MTTTPSSQPAAASAGAASSTSTSSSSSSSLPPDGLPAYRLLTGPDDAAFCRRVSDALALGYVLYGSPAATFNGQSVIVAQAVLWPGVASAVPAG